VTRVTGRWTVALLGLVLTCCGGTLPGGSTGPGNSPAGPSPSPAASAAPSSSPHEDTAYDLFVLELEIDSTIEITKYTNLATLATASAKGTIRLTGDPATKAWSGRGTLDSTTVTDPGIHGCNTVILSGQGQYDWVVREVIAEPGTADRDVQVWMDAGPINEQPDNVTIGLCPSGSLPGTANVWGNLFFGIFQVFYQAKGFHLDGLNNGMPDPDLWTTGFVLGESRWVGSCEMTLPEDLHTFCTAGARYTLTVVDPNFVIVH